jgi:hypothetical protein
MHKRHMTARSFFNCAQVNQRGFALMGGHSAGDSLKMESAAPETNQSASPTKNMFVGRFVRQ